MLLNSAPFFAVLMARISLKERVTLLRGLGLVIGFAGVVVIVLSNPVDTGTGGEFIFGVIAVMVGAIGNAAPAGIVRYKTVREIETDRGGITDAQVHSGTRSSMPW